MGVASIVVLLIVLLIVVRKKLKRRKEDLHYEQMQKEYNEQQRAAEKSRLRKTLVIREMTYTEAVAIMNEGVCIGDDAQKQKRDQAYALIQKRLHEMIDSICIPEDTYVLDDFQLTRRRSYSWTI